MATGSGSRYSGGNDGHQDRIHQRLHSREEAQREAQGHTKRRAEGRAEALLHVLGARGISVDDVAAQRIRSCTDIALLDSWLERAVSVRTADELFA
jgi:hypothetical protein